MKIKIGISQFSKNNTPHILQLIGDISLVLAFVASVPVLLASGGIIVPAAIITASIYATTAGTIIKLFSKTFGIKLDENK